jgi:hypothetical protein
MLLLLLLLLLAGKLCDLIRSVGPCFLQISANGLITIVCFIIGDGEKV